MLKMDTAAPLECSFFVKMRKQMLDCIFFILQRHKVRWNALQRTSNLKNLTEERVLKEDTKSLFILLCKPVFENQSISNPESLKNTRRTSSRAPQCTKSRGRLKPPFLFMYWRYFLFTLTCTAPLALPSTWKQRQAMTRVTCLHEMKHHISHLVKLECFRAKKKVENGRFLTCSRGGPLWLLNLLLASELQGLEKRNSLSFYPWTISSAILRNCWLKGVS